MGRGHLRVTQPQAPFERGQMPPRRGSSGKFMNAALSPRLARRGLHDRAGFAGLHARSISANQPPIQKIFSSRQEPIQTFCRRQLIMDTTSLAFRWYGRRGLGADGGFQIPDFKLEAEMRMRGSAGGFTLTRAARTWDFIWSHSPTVAQRSRSGPTRRRESSRYPPARRPLPATFSVQLLRGRREGF